MRPVELWKYARGAFLLLMLGACGGNSGCSGCAQEGEPFPDKDKVHSAVQIRLTEPGLTFLEENLEPLISGAIPGGLDICLPGQGGEVDFLLAQVRYGFCIDEPCADDPNQQGCNLNIDIGPIDLEAVEPNRLRARLEFDELAARIPVFAEGIIECAITIDAPGFPVQMDLVLSTPEPTRDLTFHIEDPVYQLAALNLRFESGNDGFLSPLCDVISGVLDFPIIGDVILGAIQALVDGLLPDLINGFVEDFTCRSCDEENACPIEGGSVCEGGRCMLEGSCIPAPLGIEGELNVGDLLGTLGAGLNANIKYLATPGSYVEVEEAGLSLGLISGATAEQNRCVPRRALPDPDVEPPRAEAMRGNTDPQGREYEVGIGITDVVLRRFLWSFYSSGALCLGLDTNTVEQLSTGTLRLLLPNLLELTRGETNVAITLSPQEVPIAHIGANTVIPDPDNEGQFMLDDPLLTLEIPELWMDFHAFFDDRWVRIFSLKADVVVPIGMAFAPDNGIIPVIGDLAGALMNVEVGNGEIMLDDPQIFANLLPALIGPLVGGLTDGLSDPIALPDIMGYELDLQEGSMTGVEDNTMLGIFANLERAAPPEEGEMGAGAAASVQTEITVLDVHVPTTEAFELELGVDVWKRPFVRLANDAFDGSDDGAEMEFQWRVDNHGWSLFTPAREMVVRSPAFLLQGRHTISVRGRRIDNYRTLDPSPAVVEVLIDSVPPKLELSEEGVGVRVAVSDLVTPREAMLLEVRRDGGEWRSFDDEVLDIEGVETLEVRATDEAGNASVEVKRSALIGRGSHAARTAPSDGGCGCGCNVAEDDGSDLLLGLPFVLLVGLRRKRWAAVLLLLLVTVGCDDSAAGGDDDDDGGVVPGDMGTSCTNDDACGPNEKCIEGGCRVISCADDPSICEALECENGEPAMCNGMGVCECEPFCADGCGEGEYCCLARNACEPTPDACGDEACPPGTSLMVTAGGMIDADACVVEGAQCDCVENAPVDPGNIGRFSDFVVVDGTAWFSAYAEGTGDLVVGPYAPGVGFSWTWVDGVPEGDVTGAPSGPRGGVADPGANVGQYTAIAAGDEGSLHVAYYDVDNGALKYAHGVRQPDGGHAWTLLTLDDDGDAGRWASISVSARGVPGIAYRMASRAEGEGFVSEVRYVLAKNGAPSADADWNPPMVLATSPLDAEEVETGAYPEGTGLFTAQVHDRAGNPVVAWYDRTFGQLWWSRFMDAGFGEPEMLAGWGHATRDGDMGTNVDIAIDEAGDVHFCFQNGLRDSLVYLSPAQDMLEEVDDGVRSDSGGREHAVHVVGEDCNMLLDRNGEPVIVYQDATGHDLVLAWRPEDQGEAENWPNRDLRGSENMYRGAFGFYARAQVVGDQLWVSNYVYHHNDDPPTQGLELVVEALRPAR